MAAGCHHQQQYIAVPIDDVPALLLWPQQTLLLLSLMDMILLWLQRDS